MLAPLALGLCLFGCSTTTDRESDRTILRSLHEDSLRAHREGDWEWFGRGVADDFIAGSRGELVRPSREETLAKFREYLGNTEFSRYHDVVEPIVRISEDGSLGWVLAQVYVAGVQDSSEDDPRRFDTTWTWVSLFQKQDDEWLRVGNVSNMHEGPPAE